MTCLGVLDRGKQGDDNETELKEGGGIKMSSTVLSIHYNDNYNLVYSDTTKFQLFECF